MFRPALMLFLFSLINTGCVNTEPPPNPFREPVAYPVGKSPSHMVSSDFNRDGVVDLAVANTESNTISILYGKNDGSFPNVVILETGKGPRWLIAEDFNEDERTDLAVIQNGEDSLQVFINQKSTFFFKGTRIQTERSPYAAASGDFNGDEHMDLAVVSRFDQLLILLGDGKGRFARGMKGDPGAIPTGIIAGHFNQDTFIDLAVANNGVPSSDVVFFWGKGDGTFELGDRYRNGMNPLGLLSADFNNDNRPDILSVNGLNDSLSLFLSTPEGKYIQAPDFGAEGGPVSVVAHDWNGDNRLDIVVANTRSNNISYLVAKKQPGFQHPPLNLYTGMAPFFIVKEDFNQDGRMDIAVANNNEESIAVLIGK